MPGFDYTSGIRFECLKCGICCGDTSKKLRHILALETEVEKIATVTGQNILKFSERVESREPYAYELKKSGGKCVFLQNNLCTVYLYRPLICRFYPFELLPELDSTHRFDYTTECPGIGIGKEKDATYFRRLYRLARARFGLAKGFGAYC